MDIGQSFHCPPTTSEMLDQFNRNFNNISDRGRVPMWLVKLSDYLLEHDEIYIDKNTKIRDYIDIYKTYINSMDAGSVCNAYFASVGDYYQNPMQIKEI